MEGRAATASAGDFAWIARGWLLGVFVFALRIALGLFVLEQLRRRNVIALPDALVVRFRVLQHRLGIRRVIQYCECHSLSVPAVIGFFRPVVLLPLRALTGLTPELSTTGGTSDARFIKDYCPVIEFGLAGATMHKVDENVAIADIHQLSDVYERILDSYFDAKLD